MIGAFLALDLFVFYVFWELMLIPMYFIIGIWGGERRLYAAIKFVIYTLVGSLLMLVAILYLYSQWHAATRQLQLRLHGPVAPDAAVSCRSCSASAAFALAFAIKVPIFPLHTWLPDAHVEAPTGGSVILAAVLLKFGTYGFLRFALPMFPLAAEAAAPLIAIAGGHRHHLRRADGLRAGRRQEAGRVLVGVAPRLRRAGDPDAEPAGRAGRALPDAGPRHLDGRAVPRGRAGSTTAATRAGSSDFGGLWKQTPVFAACFLVIVLASVGLPGLCGFVGEFLVLLGTFTANKTWAATGMVGYFPMPKLFGAIAASAVILAAMYLLTMYQKLMFGPLDKPENKTVRDIHGRETWVFGIMVVAALVMGIAPQPILSRSEKSVNAFITSYRDRLQDARRAPDAPATSTRRCRPRRRRRRRARRGAAPPPAAAAEASPVSFAQ